MTHREQYREEARAVRQRTRSHLARLREERLLRRTSESAGAPDAFAAAFGGGAPEPDLAHGIGSGNAEMPAGTGAHSAAADIPAGEGADQAREEDSGPGVEAAVPAEDPVPELGPAEASDPEDGTWTPEDGAAAAGADPARTAGPAPAAGAEDARPDADPDGDLPTEPDALVGSAGAETLAGIPGSASGDGPDTGLAPAEDPAPGDAPAPDPAEDPARGNAPAQDPAGTAVWAENAAGDVAAGDPGETCPEEAPEGDGATGPDPARSAPARTGADATAAAAAETVLVESDLFELPGAGVGMVWMLNRCGVQSLADLARADPEELSAALGVIGNILDLAPWIEVARSRQG